jgi:hypothetical protein
MKKIRILLKKFLFIFDFMPGLFYNIALVMKMYNNEI